MKTQRRVGAISLKSIVLLVGIIFILADSQTTRATEENPPTPTPPPTDAFLAPIVVSQAPFPELIITHLDTNQNGYIAGSSYHVTLEVKNIGTGDSGPFDLYYVLGRYKDNDWGITWSVDDILIATVSNLAPGQIIERTSNTRDLSSDVIYNTLTFPGEWVPGLPNHGPVYVKAVVYNVENEAITQNNSATTMFIYPSVPEENVAYVPGLDGDGDGFYSYANGGEDCNDTNPFVHPEAEEIQGDELDNDCQGGPWGFPPGGPPGWDFIDCHYYDDLGFIPPAHPCYTDGDGDGYTQNEGDCNDTDGNISPEQTETDNDLDDDCDRLVDEGFDFPDPDYIDMDLDGWSAGEGDCNDSLGGINPGAGELLDGVDNDCDGYIDEWLVTPDWALSNFRLERSVDECDTCGIWARFFVSGGLGLEAMNMMSRNHVHIKDLAGREYGAIPHPENLVEFIPYSQFPSQAYAESMACDPNGLIATITGGLFGEENTANNFAYYNLEGRPRDADIVFQGVDLHYPSNPLTMVSQTHVDDTLRIFVTGDILGTCPPSGMIDEYITQVKIFVENEEVHSQELIADVQRDYYMQPVSSTFTTPGQFFYFGHSFDRRPKNGDQIRIEIQLNSDERFGEDTSNNLCVIDYIYDRNPPPIENVFVPWESIRVNDAYEFINAEGCSPDFHRHPSDPLPYAAYHSLTGGDSSPWGYVVVAIFVLASSVSGGGVAWRFATRRGVPLLGTSFSTLVGALAGVGIAVIVLLGIGSLKPLQIGQPKSAEIIPPQPLSDDDLIGLIPASDDFQMKSCDEYLSSSVEVSTDANNEVEEIYIQIHPLDEKSLPIDNYFRVIVWDNQDNSTVFTTRDALLSLVSTGITPELLDPFLWQVEMGNLAGSDRDIFLMGCNPTINSFRFDKEIEEVVTPETPTPTYTPTPTQPVPTKAQPTATTPPKAADTKGPKVSGASASPNPALTTSPVTISATISDSSGVASATVYYKSGKGGYQSAGNMKSGGGNNYFLNIGTLTPAGTYTFRILAKDNLGNANCSTGNLDACPGGSFVVNIP